MQLCNRYHSTTTSYLMPTSPILHSPSALLHPRIVRHMLPPTYTVFICTTHGTCHALSCVVRYLLLYLCLYMVEFVIQRGLYSKYLFIYLVLPTSGSL
jgi:hypothetical protein